MGFGFFGLRGKDKNKETGIPAPTLKKVALPVNEIPNFLHSEFSSRMSEEREKFSALSRDILSHVDSFKKDVEAVRDKKFGTGESYYAAINMIKDTWARKALSGVSSYQSEFPRVPQDAGFTYFSGLYSRTLLLMNEACVMPKQQIVLRRFFEDESKRLGETLRMLSASMDGLSVLVRENGALRADSGVSSLLGELKGMESSVQDMKKGIASLSSEEEKKGKEISVLERQRDEIAKSPAWKDMDSIEKDRKACIMERDGIEADVSATMGALKRPLKLYAHEAPGLSKEERSLAEALSHSPSKVILSQDALSAEKLLSKAHADSKTMHFPQKDAERLAEIGALLSSGWVKKAAERHASLSKHIENSWNRMKEIDIATKKVHAEKLMERALMELDAQTKQKQALLGKLKEEESKMLSKRKEITELLKKELSVEVDAG